MSGRRQALISLITDRRRYGTGRLVDAAAAAAHAGVDIIQIRERDLDVRALLALVREIVAAVPAPARVVVNERADVALAAGAAGVHLRADSIAASEVRRLANPGFVIGRSVHSEEEARRAAAEGGSDYLLFGTVFAGGSKPAGHRVAGTAELATVCAAVAAIRPSLPVLAVGGVGERQAAAVARAGAAGLAAIAMFADATDFTALVASLRRQFDSSAGVV